MTRFDEFIDDVDEFIDDVDDVDDFIDDVNQKHFKKWSKNGQKPTTEKWKMP